MGALLSLLPIRCLLCRFETHDPVAAYEHRCSEIQRARLAGRPGHFLSLGSPPPGSRTRPGRPA